ncbi:hydrolase [Streptomyces phage Satis]|nr:hydrolase [Streptomyces phage Satis]QBZ72068.1 MutT-like nucleotide pyrophosphohydrolase [Streptomyces phage Kradal]QPL14488.1 MutT-like nucleotide pyrophosphohydrolase [Streptomyces phage EhyElimayoE]
MNRDETKPRPKVGVSLLIVREFEGKPFVLLGQRKGSHGENEWGTPGGHQEFGESYEDTALNEKTEECGDKLVISRPRFLCLTNMRAYMDQGKHYADVGMVAHWISGDPQLMEPEKCLGWTWHPIDRLPSPLFEPVENLVISYHTGQPYFA